MKSYLTRNIVNIFQIREVNHQVKKEVTMKKMFQQNDSGHDADINIFHFNLGQGTSSGSYCIGCRSINN